MIYHLYYSQLFTIFLQVNFIILNCFIFIFYSMQNYYIFCWLLKTLKFYFFVIHPVYFVYINVTFSNLFHKHLKPTHEHLMLKNLDPFLPHSRTSKKTTPIRTLPLRAMTFLRWSSQPRSPEPSWWQEGTTLLPRHQSCYYCYCRRQSFYNVKTIWHDSFWLLFCCERLPQLIKREFVGACVCLVWFPLYLHNHNNGSWIHYVPV